MSSKVLVGNARGHCFSAKTLKDWVASNCTRQLGYVLEVKVLARGWFVSKLKNPKDALWARNRAWSVDSIPVCFKL
jgi:hypothetical protein